MSIYVQRYLWLFDLAPNVKYVAVALADYALDDGTNAYPSQSTLATKTGLSVHTVRRSLEQLRKAEIIVMSRRANQRKSRCYVFPLPTGYASFRDIPLIPLGRPRGINEWLRGINEGPLEVSQGDPIHKEPSLDTNDGFDSSNSTAMPQKIKDWKNSLKVGQAS